MVDQATFLQEFKRFLDRAPARQLPFRTEHRLAHAEGRQVFADQIHHGVDGEFTDFWKPFINSWKLKGAILILYRQ